MCNTFFELSRHLFRPLASSRIILEDTAACLFFFLPALSGTQRHKEDVESLKELTPGILGLIINYLDTNHK